MLHIVDVYIQIVVWYVRHLTVELWEEWSPQCCGRVYTNCCVICAPSNGGIMRGMITSVLATTSKISCNAATTFSSTPFTWEWELKQGIKKGENHKSGLMYIFFWNYSSGFKKKMMPMMPMMVMLRLVMLLMMKMLLMLMITWTHRSDDWGAQVE